MRNDTPVMNSLESERSSIKETILSKYKTGVNYDANVGQADEILPSNTTSPDSEGTSSIDPRLSVKSPYNFIFPNKLQLFEIQKLIDDHKKESVEYTLILSSILRQIAFTEGSLFWFLKIQFQVNILSIILGFSALLLFFISDAVQYYNGYTKFKKQADIFENNMANKKVNESDYQDSQGLHLSITLPFKIKLIFLLIATAALVFDFLECLSNLNIF